MISIERQIKAVEREIILRKRVYPNRVMCKRMSQQKADEEIEAMQAVLETLREKVIA
jgi:hypothetical protein